MASVIFKKPPLRKLRKEGLFGVDMHFHTRYSLDAVSRIPVAVKKAQKKGFGFAITDHNTVDGVMHSYRLRKHTLIIPGIEITCRNGNHVLAYFYNHNELEEFFGKEIKPTFRKNPFFSELSVSQVVDAAKDYNCIMCSPHPYAPGAVSMKNTGVSKSLEKKLNLIEVFNGYNFRSMNMKALYWASNAEKAMTGGSDGHSTLELGRVLTFTQGTDIDSVFKDILKNRSLIMGREENLFMKAALTVNKERAYITKCRKQHIAGKLIRSNFSVEYAYFRKRFSERKAQKMMLEHQAERDRLKRP